MTDLTGQVGLRRNGTTLTSKIIEWATYSHSHHTILAVSETMCISAEPGGARYRRIDEYPHLDWTQWQLNDEQRRIITVTARAYIGAPYNYMVFPILLLHRLTHIPIPTRVKTWLNRRPHEDCSSLTNLIHNMAGVHLYPHGKLTTPGDYERDMRTRGWLA